MSGMTAQVESPVPAASIRLWWLGQAGFAFKMHDGTVVYLDPYLSDACEHLHGLTRVSLPAIDADEVRADWVVLTHEHTDHLDPDAIAVIARNNPRCRFAAPEVCRRTLVALGVAARRIVTLVPGGSRALAGFAVHAVAADHGDLSPGALSLLLDLSGVRILASGDTSWRPKLVQPLCDLAPDVVLPAINGAYGNMGLFDAARLVQQARPRLAIPCHYGTFAEQGCGDPGGFLDACRRLCPGTRALVVTPGRGLTIRRQGPRRSSRRGRT